MNAKKLSFLLLILVAVACTNRSTSSEQDEMRHWNNVLQQINALLLENKARQTLDLAKQTLPEILESAEKNGTTDTLIYYARKIFNACGNNYINTKQYKDGIDLYGQHWEPSPHPRTLPARTAELQGRTEPTVWQ